ncbi:hypothetical protein ALC62_15385 [Cyphomyrmex costatus]|uniref:Uncharacterized protein n=1 Tax=Cyphomyrmex costatus TaxID=456900 RepID=A0A151I7B0_9HYME|nr:hypothetical protein ALC62_15385 [Cyphomyrmex costatus]
MEEVVQVPKTYSVFRNADESIIIDEEGYITCQTDSGLTFKIQTSEIDSNGPPITCTVDNEEVLIVLTSTHRTIDTPDTNISNQENQEPNVIQHNFEIFTWNDANTKIFLSLYKEKKELVGSRRIKNFKEIAPILMPVSTTTVLPTTSNVERREEPEDMPVADESEVVTVPENANLVAVAKKRIATETTAKALQQCQEEMQEYRKTLEKRHENQDKMLSQILETYKSIKDRQEEHLTAIENHRKETIQQRQRRNHLLEEKNNLLKEFLNSFKKINQCDVATLLFTNKTGGSGTISSKASSSDDKSDSDSDSKM